MLRRLLIGWVILAIAVWVATALIPGIDVKGGVLTYLWVSLLFGLVNALLGPILRLLTLPLTVMTLGLFALVVNGFLLVITAWISSDLDVSRFVGAIAGALVITVVSTVLGLILGTKRIRG